MHRLNPEGPRRRSATPGSRSARGSALLLFPAAFLVVLLLGSIAVDSALVLLRQREATNAAADAANDIVTLAIVEQELRQDTARGHLDVGRARSVARTSIERAGLAADLSRLAISVDGTQVTVALTVEADHVFLGVVPGAPSRRQLSVRASSELVTIRP